MVFTSPSWVPKISLDDIPDSIPICDFILNEQHGRAPLENSRQPFVWGHSGQGYTATEVRQRVDYLARSLAKELGWHPNRGSEWEKAVGVFAVNTIDSLPLGWAVHRLSGTASLANSVYSANELVYQLRASKVSALFTCVSLLGTALEAADKCGISRSHVYLIDLPRDIPGGAQAPAGFKTVDQLVEEGSRLKELEPLRWEKGQGARQCAYLLFSSGTSGLPKGVIISHRNIISGALLFKQFDSFTRSKGQMDVVLGLLPQSHVFGLMVFHSSVYRGESVVVLPKFELEVLLGAIQRCKINVLYLVPPVIISMVKNEDTMKKYDLSSVRQIVTGAAPLGIETAEELFRLQPTWSILQAYGLTETTAIATTTSSHDVFFGSSGSLLPLLTARIVTPDDEEITDYDKPGELLLKGPTIVPGYLNNDKANKETFQDGWMRTGDEAVIRKSPKGIEHVFIVDRIKELIKVKGFQVAPAELEAHLLTHPAVADTAVISVPDPKSGEAPKAYIVTKTSPSSESDRSRLIREIEKHVEDHKASYKWLRGGVEIIGAIPKSASGKILRRHLRDRDREERRKKGAKL